jgi:hypothetical protein
MAASLTSIEDTRSSTYKIKLERIQSSESDRTFAIAELRVGFGAELLAPNRRFMLKNIEEESK